jgi:hypothetical protein
MADLQQASDLAKSLFLISCALVIVLSPIPVVVVFPALRQMRPREPSATGRYRNVTYPVFALWGLWLFFPILPVLLALSIWLAGGPFSLVRDTFLVVWLGPIGLSWILLMAVEVLILSWMRKLFPRSVETTKVYLSLRKAALATRRKQLDGPLTAEGRAYGVLMEFGAQEGCATLFALADGYASLYGSGGGGTLGGGLHENVRQFVRPFIEKANRCISHMRPTDSFPMPDADMITFYLLTDSGVQTSGGRTAELDDDRHALSELYHAGHEVLTQLRYTPWRRTALSMLMEKGETIPPPERKPIGVLRENGLPAAVPHSLLALADGRAGVYSVLGAAFFYPRESCEKLAKDQEFARLFDIAVSGQVPENLAQANAMFVEAADRLMGHMQPTEVFPFPAEGQTTFYVGTAARILSASALTEDLEAGGHPLSPLWRAAKDVNEQGRLASQAERAALTSG